MRRDPKTTNWLKCLVAAQLIPADHIDSRSITEVTPADLEGFTQCHFFAGIGGWSYALGLAEWPSDREVWTGSCPCQPFSCAGKGLAEKDARHLWPVFRELIRQCRPATIFGEQVASAAGRLWYAGVRADLEAMGYRVGAADLCAASAGEEGEGRIVRGDSEAWEQLLIGAPHIRQRLYWVADYNKAGRSRQRSERLPSDSHAPPRDHVNGRGKPGRMGDAPGKRRERPQPELLQPEQTERRLLARSSDAGRMADAAGPSGAQQRREQGKEPRREEGPQDRTERAGPHKADLGLAQTALPEGPRFETLSQQLSRSAAWSNFDVIPCTDNKARRVESGTFPLAAGTPGRMAQLRGLGNSIVPQIAAEFIKAYLETL
jgi:DNA (cytosine-5)-methyltransferase 1